MHLVGLYITWMQPLVSRLWSLLNKPNVWSIQFNAIKKNMCRMHWTLAVNRSKLILRLGRVKGQVGLAVHIVYLSLVAPGTVAPVVSTSSSFFSSGAQPFQSKCANIWTRSKLARCKQVNNNNSVDYYFSKWFSTVGWLFTKKKVHKWK
jgi:hypothetical protein